MVKRHVFVLLLAVVFSSATFLNCVSAQERQYHLNQEWVKIWIMEDGTIDLFYNISITLDSGSNINWVSVGQPNGDFTIDNATDQNGYPLTVSDASSGTDYKVRVNLASPLVAGHTVWFTVITNVAHMIYEDNQTNVGMEFKPTWWKEASVLDLRVLVVLPLGVNASMVGTSVDWDNILLEPDGRWAVFWQRQNLDPNQQFSFGVSFPKEYVQQYDTKPTGIIAFFQNYGAALLLFGVFISGIGAVVYVVRKKPYLIPKISMETLGVRRGLTAVEASYLLDLKPTKIVTAILYSSLTKRAVWVEAVKPSLRLRIMQKFQGAQERKELLRYYETDFLNAIKPDGMLDETKLAQTVMTLRDTVEDKMRGYCRRDTVDYYKSIVAKAWQQVEQAGTPALASNAYDEQLLWLLLDPDVKTRTQTVFGDRYFEPNPAWFWYWYGYQHYHPRPTYTPNVEAPAQAAKPPTIPGADFANNVATSLEQTANNIVVNIEKFANAIIPAQQPAKASHQPVHHGAACVCACHACACVCACVSCACACAGGGVG